MKHMLSLVFSLSTFALLGQVASLDFLMKYNCQTNQYDVNIVVLEGSASTIPSRAQFNSQISFVVPTGESFQITDMYMPLTNHQTYSGTIPLIWRSGTPTISPQAQPESDFYGVTPTLSPAAFYDDLNENDVIRLFSFTVGSSGVYDERVRFFDVDIDPGAPQMGGSDFRNGFTLGGSVQLFNDAKEESCITSAQEDLIQSVKIFPSPFQDMLTIEVEKTAQSIMIFNNNGQVYYQLSNNTNEIISINTINYPSGIYFVRIENKDGSISNNKVVKI